MSSLLQLLKVHTPTTTYHHQILISHYRTQLCPPHESNPPQNHDPAKPLQYTSQPHNFPSLRLRLAARPLPPGGA